MNLDRFSDEQARLLVNLEQQYQVWMEAERDFAELPYDLRRKEIGGKAYLYEIRGRDGNGRSLGPWSDANEAKFKAYHAHKASAKDRREASKASLDETGRLGRALRLGILSEVAGPILRESDRRRLLGSHLLVVGTNAMAAYSIEAGAFIRDAPSETFDFDAAWSAIVIAAEDHQDVWRMLKAVDPTFTVNTERPFQARNSKGYEFEMLVAPSRAANISRTDQPRPVALMEQEWLLLGRPVDRVVLCRDGTPARIIAPDPRWFALQKLWLSEQPKRNALKRPKDFKQGMALLNAIYLMMPGYKLDAEFEDSLPEELRPFFAAWTTRKPKRMASNW